MPKYTICGTVSPGFEPVKTLFESNFSRGREFDAQCVVYVGEERVVDLWGSVEGTHNEGYHGDWMQNVSTDLCIYCPI